MPTCLLVVSQFDEIYPSGAKAPMVLDPLRPEFGNTRLLLVVPDGELNLIPFAAFPGGTVTGWIMGM